MATTTTRRWITRSLQGLAAIGLVATLAVHAAPGMGGAEACPHGDMAGMGGMMQGMGGDHHGRHQRGSMNEADMHKHHERMIERVSQQLKLDAAQKANLVKLGDAMKTMRQQHMPTPPQGAQAGTPPAAPGPMGDLQAAIAGDRFDVAKAQARIDARADAMRKDSAPVLAAAATFFDSLKPEQQAQVRELLAKGPMGHGKGRMHGGMH